MVGGRVVAVWSDAADDEARTPSAEWFIEVLEIPLLRIAFPVTVEPPQIGRITFAKFAELKAVES